MTTHDEIRAEAIRLAALPHGCTSADPAFSGLSTALVGGVIGKLVQKGVLFSAYHSYKKRVWFDTAARAKRYEANRPSASAVAPRPSALSLEEWKRLPGQVTPATVYTYAKTPGERNRAIELPACIGLGGQRGRVMA